MGGCFVSVGLLISSLTSNQIVAGAVTFGVFLILWVINWPAPFAPGRRRRVPQLPVDHDHFDDFSRGVLDTKHLVYYVSFIAVGPVPDRAVGGHRTVAGVVMTRASTGWPGWASRSCSSPRRCAFSAGWKSMPVSARLDQYAMYASWAGLALVVALRAAERAGPAGATRVTACSPWSSVGRRPGHPGGGQLRVVAAEQALGLHRQPAVHAVGPDDQAAAGAHGAGEVPGLRPAARLRALPRPHEQLRGGVEATSASSTSTWTGSRSGPASTTSPQYGTVVVEYMGRKERATTDEEQRHHHRAHQGGEPGEAEGLLPGRPRRAGHQRARPTTQGLNAITDALRRDNYEFDTLVLAQANEVPADATVLVVAGPRTDLLEREVPLLEAYLDKGGQAPGAARSAVRPQGRRTDAAAHRAAREVGHQGHRHGRS